MKRAFSVALRQLAVCGFLAFATSVQAGGPQVVCANGTPVKFPGTGTINLNYDLGNLGTRTKAQADALVINAVAIWTNVATSSLVIGRGPDLPVDVTTANLAAWYPNNAANTSDGLNPVIYDTDGTIVDAIFGAGTRNNMLGFATARFANCQFTEGVAFVSGFKAVTDTTLSVVFAHEVGHMFGLDHTQLDNTQGIALTANYPLMYPIANRASISLHEDDIAAVSQLYPDPTLGSVYGLLTGTFVLADGVTPVKGANLWATETTTGKVYGVVSDYLKQNTGFFRLLLPDGTYTLRAEAVQTNFIGASSVGPYAEQATDPSFQPPLYPAGIGGAPMPIVTLGNASPKTIRIAAGCGATVTFGIDGSGSFGGNCPVFPGTLQFTVASAAVGEAAGSLTLSVSRTGGSDGPASVQVTTVGGTATSGADFVPLSVALNWAAGDSATQNVVIPIVNDALIEGDEAFSVTLSAPGGAALGAITSVTVTILDDDVATPPSAPQAVVATPGDGKAFIAFRPPASTGGSAVTGYTATCGASSAMGSGSPLVVAGLANDVAVACSVTARNAIGSGPPSTSVMVTPSASAPLTLVAVASRKVHGAAGPFDLDLDLTQPLNGAISVEPRLANPGHTLVWTFNQAITVPGVSSLDAPATGSAGVVAFAGNVLTVQLNGIEDNRRASVSVSSVNSVSTPFTVSLGFLVGDFNATGRVNASDIAAMKRQAGQPVGEANFRFDVNTSGTIDAGDATAVRQRSGAQL